MNSLPVSPSLESCDTEVILSLYALLHKCNNVLSNYCNLINSTSNNSEEQLDLQYGWASEPALASPQEHYIKMQELLDMLQSREYQVKFCHASLAKKLNTSKSKTMSLQRGKALDSSNVVKRAWKSKRCIMIAALTIFVLACGITATIILLVYRLG